LLRCSRGAHQSGSREWCRYEVAHANAVGLHGGEVRSDDNALLGCANELDVAHTRKILDLLDSGVAQVVGQREVINIGRNGHLHDGEIAQRPGDDLWVDSIRKLRLDATNGLVDFLLAEQEVGAVDKRDRDQAEVGARGGRGVVDVGHTRNGGLKDGRDVLVDHIGSGPGIGGQHRQLRELNRRSKLLLQARKSKPTKNRDDNGNEGDESAVTHAGLGKKKHGASLTGFREVKM
jgi:hypothetical protein